MKFFLFGLGLVFFTLILHVLGDEVWNANEDWVKPREWEEVPHVSRNVVDSVIAEENCPRDETYIFYKKLVNFLFDSRRLNTNGESHKITRILRLEMTPELLEKLREAQSARDIDSIIFEIVEMSRESRIQEMREIVFSIADTLSMYISEVNASDTIFFLSLTLMTLLFVWIVSRQMRRNIILVFILTILSISYFLTYLDCNRKLEIKKLMELNKADEKNPCQIKNSVFRWWQSYSEDDCFKHLTSSYGSQRSICRPTEVFIQFFSHLAITQFITFVQESHVALRDIVSNYSWQEKLVVLPIIIIFTYLVLSTVLKYSFKYMMPTILTKISDHGESRNSQNNMGMNINSHIASGFSQGESDKLILSGESVSKLLHLLTQKSTVTLKEAEDVLETEDGERVQVLPVEDGEEDSNSKAIQSKDLPKDEEISRGETGPKAIQNIKSETPEHCEETDIEVSMRKKII
ncbi:hypothetical protein DMENIID0001_027830 [Sergentomyia squamirostris]